MSIPLSCLPFLPISFLSVSINSNAFVTHSLSPYISPTAASVYPSLPTLPSLSSFSHSLTLSLSLTHSRCPFRSGRRQIALNRNIVCFRALKLISSSLPSFVNISWTFFYYFPPSQPVSQPSQINHHSPSTRTTSTLQCFSIYISTILQSKPSYYCFVVPLLFLSQAQTYS